MKKTILFMLLEQYADWEAAYLSSAIYMLGEGKFEVKTVSLKNEYVTSIGGFRTLADYDIASIPADFEALMLIGGMTWRTEDTKQIKNLAEWCLENGKVLGAICDATTFLGKVGVLNHVKHTSNELNDLKNWAGDSYTGEVNYVIEPAVSDGNVVTANGTASLEFAKNVMLTLQVAPEEKINEWYGFHKFGIYKAAMPQDAAEWDKSDERK